MPLQAPGGIPKVNAAVAPRWPADSPAAAARAARARRAGSAKESLALVYHSALPSHHSAMVSPVAAPPPAPAAFRYPRVLLGTCPVPWGPDGTCDEPQFRRAVRHAATRFGPHQYIFGTAGEG